ncbi:MAG: class I SAM-dependent methyltransferase [Nocardioidaceae bacterium]
MAGPSMDYDVHPERYRLGVGVAGAYATADLHAWVVDLLRADEPGLVLEVGCADGPLARAHVPDTWRVVGVDRAAALLRDHPGPAVLADAARLPVDDRVCDAVTAINVLYHLDAPVEAIAEAYRVLRPGGRFVASAIARSDSPELRAYWTRPPTSFDAEEAPEQVAEVFGPVDVLPWDAPLLVLPHRDALRDYLLGRRASTEQAERAADELPTPLRVTKRGALLTATKR